MSLLGEKTLLGLLVDTDSVEFLAKEGLNLDVVPTESLRPVIDWSLTYYRTSMKAPTIAVLKDRFGDLLTDHGIDLDEEPEESIEFAVDDLKQSYVRQQGGMAAKNMAFAIAEAAPDDRLEVFSQHVAEMTSTVMSLQPRTTQIDLRQSGADILADYEFAVATQGEVLGLAFGLPQIDQYTRGIQDGELALVAGGAKTGKSWFLNHVALSEWQRGRTPCLFTLENSIKMTQMRIACMALHISIEEMQEGRLEPHDVEALRTWVNDVLLPSDNPFLIFNPDMVQRTPQAIVQAAKANGADSLIVDQLTHMSNGRKRSRDQSVAYETRDIIHDLKGLISTGRHQMPCLLAHQIKRDGMKSADKTGRLHMTDLADSADVERTVDWAFGLYASNDMRQIHSMQFQTLATRRAKPRDYDLLWQIEIGVMGVRNEIEWD